MKTKLMENKFIKYIVVISLFIFGLLLLPTLSKYLNNTTNEVIKLFTKYHVTYVADNATINNIEKFSSYVSINGLTLPTDDDIERIGYSLAGWYNSTEYTGEPITEINRGEVGNKTFYAAWDIAKNLLKTKTVYSNGTEKPGLPADITIIKGKNEAGEDNVIDLSNGEISVLKNELISLRIPYASDISISNFEINVDLVERLYVDGDPYVYYDFKMPNKEVTIDFYDNDLLNYIDISKSSIIFEDNVSYGAARRIENGFWYSEMIPHMTPWFYNEKTGYYFYIWDSNDTLYVTSNNVPTQNQLVLIKEQPVHLKNCNLVARSEYSNNAVDRKLNGVSPEFNSGTPNVLNFTNSSSIGNIILSYSINQTYDTNIYIDGDNTIASIIQSEYIADKVHQMNLNIFSDNISTGTLYLGSVFGNMNLSLKNMTVKEYNNDTYADNSEYLIYTSTSHSTTGNITIIDATVDAPTKRIVTAFGYIYYKGTSYVTIGSTRHAYCSNLYDNAYVHILGDMNKTYQTVSIMNHASLIIEGNILGGFYDNGRITMTSDKFLIIKGSVAQGESISLTNGVLIANNFSGAATYGISGGVLITNQITNYVFPAMVYDESGHLIAGNRTLGNSWAPADKNDDNLPFLTYNNTRKPAGNFTLSNGSVFLFGHYKLDDAGNFDLSVTAMDDDNPIKKYIAQVLDENGNLKNDASIDLSEVEIDIKNRNNTDSECIILGDSSIKSDEIAGRTFIFNNKAKLFAAGNLTFYANTEIKGGTIYANGSISSKQDLTINGGTVIADKIGTKQHIKVLEGSQYRWHKVNLYGGTVKTNAIGAVDTNSKTKVNLGLTNIVPLNDSIDLSDDIYINYNYSSDVFSLIDSPDNLHFVGSIMGNVDSFRDTNLHLDSIFNLNIPTLLADNSNGRWLYGSLLGPEINSINTDGQVTAANDTYVFENDYISLYAVKENYKLSLGDGLEYISSVDVGDSFLTDFKTQDSVDISANSTVNITLTDNTMLDKVVIWYKDDANIYHNALPTIDSANNKISFKMPYANTELFITNELTLYQDEYNISFTSDGFRVMLDSTEEQFTFSYAGDFKVKQKNSNNDLSNYNRIVFETGSGNILEDGTVIRNITLDNIIQGGFSSQYGTEVAAGEHIKYLLTGTNNLLPIKAGGNVTLTGVNGPDLDTLRFKTDTATSYSFVYIPTTVSSITTTFENVYIDQSNRVDTRYRYGQILTNAYGVSNHRENKHVVYKDCNISFFFYAYCSFGYGIDTITLDNTNLLLDYRSDTSSYFSYSNKITIKNNSEVSIINYGGGRNTSDPFIGTNEIEIIDSSYIRKYKTANITNYETHSSSYEAKKVTLRGNSRMEFDQRIYLNSLELYDNSRVEFSTSDSYLLCSDIIVNDNASIDATHIIVSGYYSPKDMVNSESLMLQEIENPENVLDGNIKNTVLGYVPRGLVINGGTVNATEFVGGDRNSKITLNGGTLNGNKIGTIGYIYGITTYVPKPDEPYVYKYASLSDLNSTINLVNGTINVVSGGYLGGMNGNVNISGGTVNLADGAYLGMTDSDKTRYKNYITSNGNIPSNISNVNISSGNVLGNDGNISVPYSILNITGINTMINVGNITGEKGSINIFDTNNNYDNPYVVDYGSATHDKVGIIISKELNAQNIVIGNGAVVYAKKAVANTLDYSDVGLLRVDSDEGNESYLYSDYYGSDGKGISTIETNNNALLHRLYGIHYNLNDSYINPATNNNPLNYVENSTVVLVDPVRYGYNFIGWYDIYGNEVTTIDETSTEDVVLEARWEAKKVQFAISTSYESTGLTKDEFARQIDLSLGEYDSVNGIFTYNRIIEVEYNELLVGSGRIVLTDYDLADYKALGVKINNSDLNPDNLEINAVSYIVDASILDYYMEHGTPISISVTSFTNKA